MPEDEPVAAVPLAIAAPLALARPAAMMMRQVDLRAIAPLRHAVVRVVETHAAGNDAAPEPPVDRWQLRLDDCPICFEPFTRDISVLMCGHYFHDACIEQSARTTGPRCPVCRG